jgi:anti-sigma regulatory factor (Ser/Thr protein kinase)
MRAADGVVQGRVVRARRDPPSLVLPATLSSVRRARRFVEQECSGFGMPPPGCEQVVLLASELVTNAILHGRSEVRIDVSCVDFRVRVTVHDENSRHPVMVSQDPDALDGRGLALVAALCSDWGVDEEATGKAVWFELPVG